MKKILFLLFVLAATYSFAQNGLRTRAQDEAAPELENLSGLTPGDMPDLTDFETADAQVVQTHNVEGTNEDDTEVSGTSKNIQYTDEKGLKDIITDVYPNPASSFIVIKLAEPRVVMLTIINLVGQEVMKKEIAAVTNYIDISELKEGIYFVNFMSGDEKVSQKIKVTD
jgi:hypothetical protein